jgi:hypothetical protein
VEGSCRTPIAALAELGLGDTPTLTARAALPDGSEMHEDLRCGPRSEPERLDIEAGEAPRHRIGPVSRSKDGDSSRIIDPHAISPPDHVDDRAKEEADRPDDVQPVCQ